MLQAFEAWSKSPFGVVSFPLGFEQQPCTPPVARHGSYQDLLGEEAIEVSQADVSEIFTRFIRIQQILNECLLCIWT